MNRRPQNGLNRLPHLGSAQGVASPIPQQASGMNLQMPIHGKLCGVGLLFHDGPQPPSPSPAMTGAADRMLSACAVAGRTPMFFVLEPRDLTLFSVHPGTTLATIQGARWSVLDIPDQEPEE